jgi:hypothetical protein
VFGSRLKVMCCGSMVLRSGMVDEVLSLSIHQVPRLKSEKLTKQPAQLMSEKT